MIDIGRYQLMLKAVVHNWGLKGSGDWSKIEWRIFYDGSYEVIKVFAPSHAAYNVFLEGNVRTNVRTEPEEEKTTGVMAYEAFIKLEEAIKCKPWGGPSLCADGCDGDAWEIESYREDGSVENTSGKPGYIYGQRVLETIVSLLPRDYNSFSFGFVY